MVNFCTESEPTAPDGLILLQVLCRVPTIQRNGKTGRRLGSLRIRE